MDNRYFAVKAARERFLQINIDRTEKSKIEMKFLQLQSTILLASPPVYGGDSTFDGLTLLVEELAEAPYRHHFSVSLYKHLNNMINTFKGEAEQSANQLCFKGSC